MSASTAIIGQPFTFASLFLDADNAPIVVTGPMIKVFRFAPSGNEVVLTTTSLTAISGDPGRYQYTYSVPSDLAAGGMLYAVLYGTDPTTSGAVVQEISVQLVAPAVSGNLIARFLP